MPRPIGSKTAVPLRTQVGILAGAAGWCKSARLRVLSTAVARSPSRALPQQRQLRAQQSVSPAVLRRDRRPAIECATTEYLRRTQPGQHVRVSTPPESPDQDRAGGAAGTAASAAHLTRMRLEPMHPALAELHVLQLAENSTTETAWRGPSARANSPAGPAPQSRVMPPQQNQPIQGPALHTILRIRKISKQYTEIFAAPPCNVRILTRSRGAGPISVPARRARR